MQRQVRKSKKAGKERYKGRQGKVQRQAGKGTKACKERQARKGTKEGKEWYKGRQGMIQRQARNGTKAG